MGEKPLISFDFAIKHLLRDKGDYDIVEAFISALLKSEGYGPIKITALLESESNKEKCNLKRSTADVVVEDADHNKYIVEIERAYTSNFAHKACFNSSRLIVDSISKAEDYATIKKVFHISILYFTTFEIKKALYHGKTIFKEVGTNEHMDLHLASLGGQIYDLNILPEYFFISVPAFDGVVKSEIDEWLYIMKNSEVREDFKSPCMNKVKERLSILTMSDEEKDAYYRYMKEALNTRDIVDAAKAEGKAEGKTEGIIEGEKGKAIAIAKKMLKEGMDLELILKLTQLSIAETEDLR